MFILSDSQYRSVSNNIEVVIEHNFDIDVVIRVVYFDIDVAIEVV